MALLEKNSQSSLYKCLSSFWIKHFKDSTQLETLYIGAESLLGNMYLDLMETVLSKSLTTIPVFKKQDWELLILQDNLLSFDPPVPSSDTYSSAVMDVSIVADAVNPSLDNVYVSFADMLHRRTSDTQYYPTHGIYNHALTGKSANTKNWTVILQSNATVKDAIKEVKARIVSNKEITLEPIAETLVMHLNYNEANVYELSVTPDEYALCVTTQGLAELVELKLNHADIKCSIEAGHLIIKTETKRSIRPVYTNAACEAALHVRQFNFIINVRVPVEVEDTAKWSYAYYLQLVTSGYKATGIEYRFAVSKVGKNLRSAKFIMNTIYSPTLLLEEGRDYEFRNEYLYFKQNPFEFENVAFRVINGQKQLALWMSDVAYDNDLLYKRYGYRFTAPRDASDEYKLFLRGIMFYYTNGPDVASITAALNLIAGIPVAIESGEVVLSVYPGKIITDRNEYDIPLKTKPTVSVGQTLEAFDVLTDAFEVKDYLIDPEWFDNIFIPQTIMPGANTETRQLKKSVAIPAVGDPSSVVGPLDTSATYLVTDNIAPYGAGKVPYALPSDAVFELEFTGSNKTIYVNVPKIITSGAYYLEDVARAMNSAMTQVSGVPYTSSTLDADASFDMVCDAVKHTVVVPAGKYPSLVSVSNLVRQQLPTSILTMLSEDENRLLFLNKEGKNISIQNPSVTAQALLGIQGTTSMQGVHVKVVGSHLEIANLTSESGSLMRMSYVNATALNCLGMKPFRPGSGNMVGEQGQSNLSYRIFDEILKYNTFKISFNLGNFTVSNSLEDVVDIVISGKPSYTTPIITPYIQFDDSAYLNPIVVDYDEDMPSKTTENMEYGDVNARQSVDIVFRDFEGVHLVYDEAFKDVEYISLDNVGFSVPMNNGESSLVFAAKNQSTVGVHHHKVTIAMENNLKQEDAVIYASPGIYNTGVQTQGHHYGPVTLAKANNQPHVVGIYNADFSLVTSEALAELDSRITHMFVLDRTRKDRLQDLGFGEGDFFTLKGWPAENNNGKFSILSVSYDIKFKGTSVDILWYRNVGAEVDNITTGKNIYDGSTYTFSYKSGNQSKGWFITMPKRDTIKQQLDYLLSVAGDDKGIFPFKISFLGPSSVWNTSSYNTFYTAKDRRHPRSFLGERYQTSLEWIRYFHVGDGTSLEPGGKLILDDDAFSYKTAFLIGVASNPIGDKLSVGNPATYAGSDYSTIDKQKIVGTLKVPTDIVQDTFLQFNGHFHIDDGIPIVGDLFELGDHDYRQRWGDGLNLFAKQKLSDTMPEENYADAVTMQAAQYTADSTRITLLLEHPYMEIGASYSIVGSTSFYLQDLPVELRGAPTFEYLLVFDGHFAESPIADYQEQLAH